MNALAARLIAAAFAALVLFGAVMYVRELRAELALAKSERDTAMQGNAERDDRIRELSKAAQAAALAHARLEGERNGIRQASAEREEAFRRLIDENKEIRAWAAAAVPADVIRLRNHGPHTGAVDYRKARTQGDALHPAGGRDPQ